MKFVGSYGKERYLKFFARFDKNFSGGSKNRGETAICCKLASGGRLFFRYSADSPSAGVHPVSSRSGKRTTGSLAASAAELTDSTISGGFGNDFE